MRCIEKEPIYDVYCIGRRKESIYMYDVYCIGSRQYRRYLNILFWGCLSGALGSVDVWCCARRCCRGRGFESRWRQTIRAPVGSVDLLCITQMACYYV